MRAMGKFIVIDGGEGSGKGTVIESLKQMFSREEVIFSREPGGSPMAEKVREVIFSAEAKVANDPLTNFALFWAARASHMKQTVRPTLLSGVSVICDRFDMSTYAYQLHGQMGKSHPDYSYLEHLFWEMRSYYCSPDPDLYIYLDVDPEEGLRRIKERNEGNYYDELPLEFHQSVREGYLNFLGPTFNPHDPRRAIRDRRIVDANAPLSEVVEKVKKIVLDLVRPVQTNLVR